MEKKKRNSILSTFPKDEDQTTEFGMRLKRRVSFSEKKSIRVFSGEDVPKTWDNSYELSDRNDSNQNSQNKIEGYSNESQAHSSSALCTTTEFINKSNLSEVHVDHSLSLTLCAYELQSIAKNWDKPKINNEDEINSNIQVNIPNSTNTMTPGTTSENTYAQPKSTSRLENFVYINENSNKENIAPESYDIIDVVSTKKSSIEKPETTKMDTFDTSDGYHINTKSSKIVAEQVYTNTPSIPVKALSTDEMDITELAENVSGICPIPESPTPSNNQSPLDFFSPLIPPGILPKCNKKLDFLQLNEDMANGRLKLFPNIQKASSNAQQIGRLISTPFFAPKTSSLCLDMTDKNVENCNSERKGQTIYQSLEVEPASMNISKGAIPKNKNTIRERTTYIETLVEMTTDIDDDPKHRNLKSQTVYYDDCIESEKDTTNDQQSLSTSIHKTINCDLEGESEKTNQFHSQNKTYEDQRNIKEASSMELSESPHKAYGCKIPVDGANNTKNNRRTIYLEDESIEIEVEEPNSVTENREISVPNPSDPVKKLEFLKTFSDNGKISKSRNRYTHHFENDEQLDFINSSSTEQSLKRIQIPKVRRDTHYFDRSGIMDMTNDSNGVVGDLDVTKEIECIIPETAAMESMIETITQRKISTNYFDDNQEPNENHECFIPESEEPTEGIRKSPILDISNQKRNLFQNLHRNDTLLEESNCEIPESQPIAFTLQQSKIPNITVSNQSRNLTKYFYKNELMEESDCEVPESQPMATKLQTSMIPERTMSNQKSNFTIYYQKNDEPIEEDNDCFVPESQEGQSVFQTAEVSITSMQTNEKEDLDKENECVIPESEPVESNAHFPKALKGSMSNQKHRLTQYFNENEQMNITNDTNNFENYRESNVEPLVKTQFFNNTELMSTSNESQVDFYLDKKSGNHQSNAVSKCLFAVQCSRLGNENEHIKNQAEMHNKPSTKIYETRKTTYFGSDESLNMTNLSDKQNLIRTQNVIDTQPLQSTTYLPSTTCVSTINQSDSPKGPLELKDVVSKNSGNRHTYIFNNNDSMNITNIPFHTVSVSNAIDQNRSSKRYTQHFNNSDAHIHLVQDSTGEMFQKESESRHSSKQTYRKTCHFEDDGQMDVTNTSTVKQQEEFLHRPTVTTFSNKKSDKNSSSIQRLIHNNQSKYEAKQHQQLESKIYSANKQKNVLFSSTVDEIEIETTPTSPLKSSGYRYDAFSPATPHRSILEFLRMEREAEEEDQNDTDNTYTNEPILELKENSFSNQKRTTSNLTPSLPESKKQRHDFNSKKTSGILKEKQMNGNSMDFESSKSKETHFMEGVVPLTETYKPEMFDNKSEKDIDMGNTLVTEDIENLPQEPMTPSHKEARVSRIPIYSGSAKKKRIPRRSSDNMNSLLNLDFSLHTVEMARFAVNDVENSRYVLRDGLTSEFNLSKKDLSRKRSIFVTEDNPITVSDVSEHYLLQKQRRTFTLDVTSNKNKDKNDQLMESLLEIIDGDDIEKTKLDLVETLLEETEQEDHQLLDDREQYEKSKSHNITESLHNENVEQATTQSPCYSITPETQNIKKHNVSLCRKCKRCQDTCLNETVSTETNDSFAMPPLPSFSTLRKRFLNGMEKMRRGPTLEVAFEFYERIKLQQSIDIFNISVDKSFEEENAYEDPFVKEYRKRLDQLDKDISTKLLKAAPIQKPFVTQLKELLSEKDTCNWILNDDKQHRQILRLRHKQIVTFCIIIQYDKKDPFGFDIVITHISVEDSSIPKRTWTPYDFMTNFQLKLELPFNLRSYCSGNSVFDVYEMLLKIDRICRDVSKMSKDLWKIAIEEDCNLIRDNDQTSIRKIVRNVINDSDGFYLSTEKTEFRVEVSNIKKLCFQDVTKPLLYMFREDIQNLPVGLEFLKAFLKNPKSFLKNC